MSYQTLCLFTFTLNTTASSKNKTETKTDQEKKIRNSFAICLINTRRPSSCYTRTHTHTHSQTPPSAQKDKLTLTLHTQIHITHTARVPRTRIEPWQQSPRKLSACQQSQINMLIKRRPNKNRNRSRERRNCGNVWPNLIGYPLRAAPIKPKQSNRE